MAVAFQHVLLMLVTRVLVGSTTSVHLSTMGPYKFYTRVIEDCEDIGSGKVRFGLKINYRGHGKYVIHGPFTVGVPIDDKATINVKIYNWGNGGWKYLLQHSLTGCENMKKLAITLVDAAAENVGIKKECPIPSGNYSFTDWPAHERTIDGVPVFYYGKYKSVVTAFHAGEKVGCLLVIGDIVPKDDKLLFK